MIRVLLIFALMFVLAWGFWRVVDGIIEAFGGTTRQRRKRPAPMKLVRDPMCGTQDGTFDMTIPKRPIRKKITGLTAFTTIRGGAYFFLPGIRALRYLASLNG